MQSSKSFHSHCVRNFLEELYFLLKTNDEKQQGEVLNNRSGTARNGVINIDYLFKIIESFTVYPILSTITI